MNIRLIALLCTLPLMGAEPAGFAVWTAQDLKGIEQKLATKIDGQRFASQQLEKFGNHYTMVAHREGNGSAELHETEADLFVVESGSAKLIVGGKIVNPKNSAPHEVRGASIEGGSERMLSPGDIVHIPAQVPHQLLLNGSKEFTYFVMKVSGQ